jgi:hypothetical protein
MALIAFAYSTWVIRMLIKELNIRKPAAKLTIKKKMVASNKEMLRFTIGAKLTNRATRDDGRVMRVR